MEPIVSILARLYRRALPPPLKGVSFQHVTSLFSRNRRLQPKNNFLPKIAAAKTL